MFIWSQDGKFGDKMIIWWNQDGLVTKCSFGGRMITWSQNVHLVTGWVVWWQNVHLVTNQEVWWQNVHLMTPGWLGDKMFIWSQNDHLVTQCAMGQNQIIWLQSVKHQIVQWTNPNLENQANLAPDEGNSCLTWGCVCKGNFVSRYFLILCQIQQMCVK